MSKNSNAGQRTHKNNREKALQAYVGNRKTVCQVDFQISCTLYH